MTTCSEILFMAHQRRLGRIMAKWLLAFWLPGLLAAAVDAQAQVVRDHREPAAAAQWRINAGQVDTLSLHPLYNAERKKYLVASGSSGSLAWEDTRPPASPDVIFENCTRAGELVYGSDRVAIRFGTRFVVHPTGSAIVDWTSERERGCEFRLIPSAHGLAAAGSGDGKFAIYNIAANRYLIASPTLRWQQTASGKPPSAVPARADFVPIELFLTAGMWDGKKTQTAYLTIQNIGNVPSSASQREMKVKVRGEEMDFRVLQPVAPGAILTNPVPLSSFLAHCERVTVELDTNPRLKFQVGQGAFSNAEVFANDKKVMIARYRGGANPDEKPGGAVTDCEPPPAK
jgi:hypothetical protein